MARFAYKDEDSLCETPEWKRAANGILTALATSDILRVMSEDLDSTDRRIIGLLRENARRTFQDIGGRVGLSAPAVKRRVDRLERERFIRGYSAIVDPSRFGWPTVALVELYCDGRMSARQVEAAVRDHPEVASAFTVAGAASAVLVVRSRDTAHLEQTLDRIRDAEGILRTQTSVVLSTLLDRPFATA